MRGIYKYLILFAVLIASVVIFYRSIPNLAVYSSTATVLQSSTFPVVSIKLDDKNINTLRGYSGELSDGIVRESITPIDTTKSFDLQISGSDLSAYKKLDYALYDLSDNSKMCESSVSAFKKKNSSLYAPVKLDVTMDTGKEYNLMFTLTTNKGKYIHYYTRIKYYESDFFLDEKLTFVKNFHKATFDKGKLNISDYIEPTSQSNNSLADVTINSSSTLIKWNKTVPNIITPVTTTINEINIETAAISLDYFVTLQKNKANETYHVTEYYRVRLSKGTYYLLNYKRKMEAIFKPELTSLTKSEFKIGITDKDNFNISISDDNEHMAFVRNGTLWSYNLKNNQLGKVFSFEQGDDDYLTNDFDSHDIKIINMKNSGNIDFVVYGYMNSGDYEGRVSIILYAFNAKKNELSEKIYVPLNTTYDRLKEDFGSFCYINDKNDFYFTLNGVAYKYNTSSRKNEILSDNISSGNFAMIKSSKSIILSNATKDKPADKITIQNIDTGKKYTVESKEGDTIKVLGTIDSNLIYGFVHNSDIYTSDDGTVVSPAYETIIADPYGKTIRSYKKGNIYVTGVEVKNKIITIYRSKKQGRTFKPTSNDSMLTESSPNKAKYKVTTRVTKRLLTEKYISLPSGTVLDKIPETTTTKNVKVSENTNLYIKYKDPEAGFYIYSYGRIDSKERRANSAIKKADAQMGVVTDEKGNVIWERGGAYLSQDLAGFDDIKTRSNISSLQACCALLLRSNQITVKANNLKGYTPMSVLNKKMDNAVNLKGCSIDEIIYFVSSKKPVIAKISSNHYVLITGYTSANITYYDPETGRNVKRSLSAAEDEFEKGDNSFYSYL
ncbi:MAG: C39 family peptidase [Lachnospiraceae bacterium]|nr:C39 family peptidase [Lachnospiraceae bacterium]